MAELIGFNTDQVRHYVRRKLVHPARGPKGEFRFSFQDVVLLRTAKSLMDASVTTRKAYRALVKLKQDLDQVKNLSSVRIFANGSRVVVRDDEHVWEVETGQTTLDFDATDLSAPGGFVELAASRPTEEDIVEIGPRQIAALAKDSDDLDTDEWYNLGLDLEEVEPERAPEAYKQSIRLDPKNADAHVNLGRLYQLKGDLKHAKRHYELALTARPGHQLAYYNLGTVFDELDEMEKASEYYVKAPSIPDAHYNLARIRELQGDEVSALRHMRNYRDLLDTDSDD